MIPVNELLETINCNKGALLKARASQHQQIIIHTAIKQDSQCFTIN